MARKSASKNQIGGFNEGIPYGAGKDRAYNRYGTAELLLQHEYNKPDNKAIQIAIDFYSDLGTWEYDGTERVGDFSINNLGDSENPETYSKEIRFESSTESDEHTITFTPGLNQENGFYPNIFYFGNHNLTTDDTITVQAWDSATFTGTKLYEIVIEATELETFHVNFMPYQKTGFYKFIFNLAEERILKLGRLIMAGSLPTTVENSMQNGYSIGRKHYKDTMTTEYKTRITNTLAYCKKISFDIRLSLTENFRLHERLQELVREGNGNRPFLFVPYPKEPNKESLYGQLPEPAEFTHDTADRGNYSFDVEEIK